MRSNSVVNHFECGFTLLEVLFAFLITGIFVVTILHLFTDQWRGVRSLNNHLEAHYAVMTAGSAISTEIRAAQTVNWVQNTKKLNILPLPNDANPLPSLDCYFIDDLDNNGVRDLYWRHLGTSQPIASNITGWECVEVEPGLWNVFLEASVNGQKVSWRCSVRQRLPCLTTVISRIVILNQQGMSVF